ncbi:MAG: hypothetical protein ACT4QG_22105 [Sporichthyaceae bacterium]
MSRVGGRSVLAAAVIVVPVLSATAAWADEEPISVSRHGMGSVEAVVVDRGTKPSIDRELKHAPAVRCVQQKSPNAGGYATDSQFASGAPPTAGAGGWVVRTCSDGRVDTAWVEDLPRFAPVEQLARRATNRMPLPLPAPKFNPSRPSNAGPATLVAIPTWFWIEGWAPVRQRTRAGGVWAEVVATPVEATWDPGDGSPVVRCIGPGTAWTPEAAESACEHTYVRSSAGQPANVYTARVDVTWRVTWRGTGGRSGTLPLMQRQMIFPIAVAERQTVVTVGGPR